MGHALRRNDWVLAALGERKLPGFFMIFGLVGLGLGGWQLVRALSRMEMKMQGGRPPTNAASAAWLLAWPCTPMIGPKGRMKNLASIRAASERGNDRSPLVIYQQHSDEFSEAVLTCRPYCASSDRLQCGRGTEPIARVEAASELSTRRGFSFFSA